MTVPTVQSVLSLFAGTARLLVAKSAGTLCDYKRAGTVSLHSRHRFPLDTVQYACHTMLASRDFCSTCRKYGYVGQDDAAACRVMQRRHDKQLVCQVGNKATLRFLGCVTALRGPAVPPPADAVTRCST